jgi:hypothetical protein
MKYFLVCSLVFLGFVASAQSLFAYMDFNNFFRVYKNGYAVQIDHQAINNLSLGDNICLYKNFQNDLKMYDGNISKILTGQNTNYIVSDNIGAWNIGSLLYYVENGVSHAVTNFGGQYAVGDSIYVYQDIQQNTLNARYKGENFLLVQTIEDISMAQKTGDNLVIFEDNGGVLKVFWRGEISEIGISNANNSFNFEVGCDVFAYNDPQTNSLIVFDKGEFVEVSDRPARKIKACRGFVVFEDNNGNLKKYQNGNVIEIASFFNFWDAKDDVVIWGEANSTFTLKNDSPQKVVNYSVTDYQIKNDVIAFRTIVGGVGAFINGQYKEITNLTNNEYLINGHGVMVTLTNRTVMIYDNGAIIRD